MFEKVNPSHPDKVADRIAGAIVDLAYAKQDNPRIAVEVLIGHNSCNIIAESSVHITNNEATAIVKRILGKEPWVHYAEVPQDPHLAANQAESVHCGDNGIFKGMPMTEEQRHLTQFAVGMYYDYKSDGKFILADDTLTICQSNAPTDTLLERGARWSDTVIANPLGDWTGGTDVDTGATNRKLGSDMGDSVTGGGLHGKDLSKADVSANIWCWLKAQELHRPVEAWCSIGDETVHTTEGEVPYAEMVTTAREFIHNRGGFESFAEWGLIR